MYLVADIETVILEATHGRVASLEVETRENEIVVHGRCPTFACKKLVQDSVMPLLGDTKLINAIEVG